MASRPVITARDVAEHYDFFLPFYRLLWGDHLHHGLFISGRESPRRAQEQMIEHCVAGCGLQRGARVLDVGCGHGGTAIHLARQHGCRVTGITVSRRQARRAAGAARRAGVDAQTAWIAADAESLAFPAAAFDAVWMIESSEHFRDKAAMFRRAAQALVAGGRLALAAWTGDMACARVREVADIAVCPALQTVRQYAEQIATAGFTLLAQDDLSAAVERTWEICCRRARLLRPVAKILPRRHRRFADGLEAILAAYRSGEMGYTTIFAERR